MPDARAPRVRALWFVTRKYPPAIGGMERLSYELTTRIAARRPARILALRGPAVRLPWFMLASAVRVAAGALRGAVGVLHLGDPVLAPIGRLAQAFGVPVCVTVHGLDVTYPHPLYRIWLRAFLLRLDAFVCISAAARAAAVDRGVPAAATSIIGIGIEPPPPSDAAREHDVLLFVGRVVPRKGLAWFVEYVLPAIVRVRPSVRLVVVGDGPDRQHCERAARDANVAQAVAFLGAVDDAEKARWLARASVCVMPNVPVVGDIEGYGIAALEAAAAGCPLVAADLEGLRDAVASGMGGVLVPAGNAQAWTDAVLVFLADPRQAQAFGRAAREWVARERAWDRVCDAYEQVFAELRRDR